MNNIKYTNKEIKEFYFSLTREHPGLKDVMLNLLNKNNILIQNIINEDEGITLNITLGDEVINIHIDFLKSKIYVISPSKSYKEVYDIFHKKNMEPNGIEYQNGERTIIKKNYFEYQSDGKNKYFYEINDFRR